MERTFVEEIGRIGDGEHGDDLEYRRRDGEEVGVECGEAKLLEGVGQVSLDR